MQKDTAQLVKKIITLKGDFSAEASKKKLQLLQQLDAVTLTSATQIKNYHECLLFLLAYPCSRSIYTLATAQLHKVTSTVEKIFNSYTPKKQTTINGSGIFASELVCAFSYEMAAWLLDNFGTDTGLHSSGADAAVVSRVMELALPKIEYQEITQTACSLQQRIQKLTGQKNGTRSLQWLLQTLQQQHTDIFNRNHLYEQLQVFVHWKLHHPFFNRSYLRALPATNIYYVKTAAPVKNHARYISQKINAPLLLAAAEKKHLLNTARAALALHCRETDPVTFGDSNTVTYFNMGHGISIALFTMLPQHRFSIESYIGYMAFVNGVPAAYGGGWLLAHRCKIGIHIFPAVRGGNSGLLFASILRLYHQYYKAQLFVVKPYQFGKGNTEGLRSGAFWFYYKLGFRPATAVLQQLALDEVAKKQAVKKYRTPFAVLQKFTTAPLQLLLNKNSFPVYDGSDISKAITKNIISHFDGNRQRAISFFTKQVKKLAAGNGIKLTATQGSLLKLQSPWMALLQTSEKNIYPFTKKEVQQFIRLMLAKYGADERDYILQLQQHKKLWKVLNSHIENQVFTAEVASA